MIFMIIIIILQKITFSWFIIFPSISHALTFNILDWIVLNFRCWLQKGTKKHEIKKCFELFTVERIIAVLWMHIFLAHLYFWYLDVNIRYIHVVVTGCSRWNFLKWKLHFLYEFLFFSVSEYWIFIRRSWILVNNFGVDKKN